MGLGQSAVFEVRQALEWRCGRRWLNGPLVGRQNIVSCILAKWKSVQLDWKPGSCSPYHRFAYKRHSSTWKLSIIARHLIRLLLLLLVQGASILFLSDARLLRRLRTVDLDAINSFVVGSAPLIANDEPASPSDNLPASHFSS